jgi:hypothetical protein
MSQEFLRSLVPLAEFSCIQIHIQETSHPPGNDRRFFQSFIVIPYCVYFLSFLCTMSLNISEGCKALVLLEPKTCWIITWIFAAKVAEFFLHFHKSCEIAEAYLKKSTRVKLFLRNLRQFLFIWLFSSNNFISLFS